MKELTSRRKFLKRTALAGVGAALGATLASARTLAAGQSRLVIVRDGQVQDEQGRIDRAVLERMLDQTLKLLAGEDSAVKAWEKFFSPEDRVGIKPSGLAGPSLSTATALIQLCLERLDGIGVKAENIIVWEQHDSKIASCGLPLQPEGPGVRIRGINGDWDTEVSQGAFRGRLTRIVTQRIDAILNLPILKDHNIAGMVLAMKNHYGSIDNPHQHHANRCNPAIADLNSLPAIREKTRLIIGDLLRPLADRGPTDYPPARWRYNGLMASTDPVAIDYQGWQILEARRAEVGLPSLEKRGRKPDYIASAAERGLGTNDPAKIELIERDLG